MKTHIAVVLTSLLFALSSQSSQESPELRQATELSEQVAKLLNERKVDEALPLAKRALQIRETLLPPNDVKISISLNFLGTAYIMKGDFDDASKILERLLKTLEERFGPDDANLLPTLTRLASLYNREDNARKTEETYLRVLALREKVNGPEDTGVAETTYALGQFYRLHGDFDRARSNYKRSLMIYGKLSGIRTPEFERASNGFRCLAFQGKHQEALFNELQEIRAQLGPRSWFPDISVLNRTAKELVRPEFPAEARRSGVEGSVYVWIHVNEEGKVISASDMCQGPPYLTEAAINAALKSTFWARKVDGVPAKFKGIIEYNFRLR